MISKQENVEITTPRISVIIPVFNEEKRVAISIDSVLKQKTSFEIEILVVDDASTDRTSEILKQIACKNSSVRVITNGRNLGKGASFRRAYLESRGDYIHVLDSDDYFTSRDKLQIQFEELERNPNIFAVGHNSLIVRPDGNVELVNNSLDRKEFTYLDFVSFNFYLHTSSYLFRKSEINLPEAFDTVRGLRGDSACMYFHAYNSKLGITYLPEVYSVYNLHGEGLWSSLSLTEQNETVIDVFTAILDHIVDETSLTERGILETKLSQLQNNSEVASNESSTGISVEKFIEKCLNYSSQVYETEKYKKIFSATYTTRLLDSFLETIGKVQMITSGRTVSSRKFYSKRVAFVVSGLNPLGGGIYPEIAGLIETHFENNDQILLIVTGASQTDQVEVQNKFKDKCVQIIFTNQEHYSQKIEVVQAALWSFKPKRIYPFISHHDVVGAASIQDNLTSKTVLNFSYDHGTVLNLTNSNVDQIVYKTRAQLTAGKKFNPAMDSILIRPQFKKENSNRVPTSRFSKINTASAAARSYKLDQQGDFTYSDAVVTRLKNYAGMHFHYGPLDKKYIFELRIQLLKSGVFPWRFRYMNFVPKFSKSLLAKRISLFIAPFPVPSARILIEVQSLGMPIFAPRYSPVGMATSGDFIDPDQFFWSNSDDFTKFWSQITPSDLAEKSNSSFSFFQKHNDSNKNSHYWLSLIGQEIPNPSPYESSVMFQDSDQQPLIDTNYLWS